MIEYKLTNLIREPTRMTATSSTLIDVILTNRPRSFLTSGTLDLGLSDHHLVYAVSRSHCPRTYSITVEIRTFKNNDPKRFRNDLHLIPFDIAHILEDIDGIYWLGVNCYQICSTTTRQLNVEHQIVSTYHL